VIDAVGADVQVFKAGQRVGLGWHGGIAITATSLPPRRLYSLRNQQIFPASAMTAVMPIYVILRRTRWRLIRTIFRTKTPRR